MFTRSSLAVAVSAALFSGISTAGNPIMVAPDGFNFDDAGQISRDVGSVVINVPDTIVGGWGNGAGIHVGAVASASNVELTGEDIVVNMSRESNWQAGIDAYSGGSLKLGTQDNQLNSLVIKGEGDDVLFGIQAWRDAGTQGGNIEVHARKVDVDVSGPGAKGIYVWNGTTNAAEEDRSAVRIFADAVRINAVMSGDNAPVPSRAIQAWSQGIVEITAADLEISGDQLINTRGGARISLKGDTSRLNGDVVFAYDSKSSGTTIDADVSIVLSGTDSYWNGSARYDSVRNDGIPEDKKKVTGMKLSIEDGANWNPSLIDGDSNASGPIAVNELSLNEGVININHGSGQDVLVENLSGTGGTINLLGKTTDGAVISSGSLSVENVQAGMPLSVNFIGVTSDDVVDAEAAMRSFEGKVDAAGAVMTNTIQEGAINGSIVQVVDSTGNAGEIIQNANKKLDGYGSIAALSAVQWRHENDTLLKRMGDIRDSASNAGAWVRVYGSEQKYGSQSVKAKNTTLQLGGDFGLGSGWMLGGALSYTDSSLEFDSGDGDGDSFGAALYGTWLGANGQFVDLIAKYSRISNDFASGEMRGSFDNNAFSVSAEAGMRFDFNSSAFIEPSIGASYGRILGDDFTSSNGVSVEQDDYDSLIARAGVRAGFFLPNDKGQLYARAAVLHDFMGDVEGKASKENSMHQMQTHRIKEELGGTWVEYGMGGVFRFSGSMVGFVDMERTSGGEVDESWKWTVGGRMTF